jgi:hypothetical protein
MRDDRDTPIPVLVYRASLARTTWNLAVGTAVFGMLMLMHPAISAIRTAPTLTAALIILVCGWFLDVRDLSLTPPVVYHARAFRRPLAIMLIGSSLVAFLWSCQKIPGVIIPIALGFLARWIIYLLEIQDIRICDRRKIGLPPLSARIRLRITLITGLVIPILVLLRLPGPPLLLLSFLLTYLAQWLATCEIAVNSASPFQARATIPL